MADGRLGAGKVSSAAIAVHRPKPMYASFRSPSGHSRDEVVPRRFLGFGDLLNYARLPASDAIVQDGLSTGVRARALDVVDAETAISTWGELLMTASCE